MNNDDPQVTDQQLNDDPADAVPADGYTLEQCCESLMQKAELGVYLQASGEIH